MQDPQPENRSLNQAMCQPPSRPVLISRQLAKSPVCIPVAAREEIGISWNAYSSEIVNCLTQTDGIVAAAKTAGQAPFRDAAPGSPLKRRRPQTSADSHEPPYATGEKRRRNTTPQAAQACKNLQKAYRKPILFRPKSNQRPQ